MKSSTKAALIVFLSIMLSLPILYFLLIGMGSLISEFANPSALGPSIITLSVLIPLIGIAVYNSFSKHQ